MCVRCIKYTCQSGTQSINMIVCSCERYIYIYTTQCLLVVSTVKPLIFFRVDNN